ncbi:hypothetical protein HQN85_07610 [Pedobacter boryungensis]|uniref:VWFA domain-containing protein n=2 Tax=Pedobacter boryungensis TaxID=869962 RepID=A0ABX2DF38_9SPHI|nr:hypothetical protein [Pedobacter boryungensis]
MVFFFGCNNNDKDQVKETSAVNSHTNNKPENLNISILLDLSDRIDPTKNSNLSMEYYKRDLGYIQSISKTFEKHLSSKPIRQDDDQIQIYFEPEPLNSEINNLAKHLKLSFTKDNTSKASIAKISSNYILTSNTIYKLAISDKRYLGSDIWSFFKNKVNDYCIKPNHRNVLFVLTDGYMFHEDSKFLQGTKSSYITSALVKSLKLTTSGYKQVIQQNGYGFIPANSNLDNLEVVVLGINPARGNPFEEDVIKEYWINWFTAMNVKKFYLKSADLPSDLEPVIQKIILGK